MSFKDIKPDYSLFLLDRDNLKYQEVKVASVGIPRFESRPGSMPGQVIDITVDVDGKPQTHSFPDNVSKYYMGSMMISTDKANVIDEIKTIRSCSDRALKEIPKHEQRLEKCTQLLQDLDTEFQEKAATEARFGKIENSIGDIKSMLAQLITNKKLQS